MYLHPKICFRCIGCTRCSHSSPECLNALFYFFPCRLNLYCAGRSFSVFCFLFLLSFFCLVFVRTRDHAICAVADQRVGLVCCISLCFAVLALRRLLRWLSCGATTGPADWPAGRRADWERMASRRRRIGLTDPWARALLTAHACGDACTVVAKGGTGSRRADTKRGTAAADGRRCPLRRCDAMPDRCRCCRTHFTSHNDHSCCLMDDCDARMNRHRLSASTTSVRSADFPRPLPFPWTSRARFTTSLHYRQPQRRGTHKRLTGG